MSSISCPHSRSHRFEAHASAPTVHGSLKLTMTLVVDAAAVDDHTIAACDSIVVHAAKDSLIVVIAFIERWLDFGQDFVWQMDAGVKPSGQRVHVVSVS